MIEQTLQTLLSEVQKITKSETVIGEPIRSGDITLLPVSRVQIGFGVGGVGGAQNGSSQTPKSYNGSGVGGGIRIEPVACVVIDGTGKAQLLQLTASTNATVGKVIDLVPEIMERLGMNRDAAIDDESTKTKRK